MLPDYVASQQQSQPSADEEDQGSSMTPSIEGEGAGNTSLPLALLSNPANTTTAEYLLHSHNKISEPVVPLRANCLHNQSVAATRR